MNDLQAHSRPNTPPLFACLAVRRRPAAVACRAAPLYSNNALARLVPLPRAEITSSTHPPIRLTHEAVDTSVVAHHPPGSYWNGLRARERNCIYLRIPCVFCTSRPPL